MGEARRNQHILLAARPRGELRPDDFTIVEAPMPLAGKQLVAVDIQGQ